MFRSIWLALLEWFILNSMSTIISDLPSTTVLVILENVYKYMAIDLVIVIDQCHSYILYYMSPHVQLNVYFWT